MSNILAEICSEKRELVASRKAETSLAALENKANEQSPTRGFAAALKTKQAAGGYGLITEIKKASPSKGLIRADFDPASLAKAYEAGGAACLSVLTDTPYFQGQDSHLVEARGAVGLPVLRKDFMVDPYQVAEARALGADCILIIMAALSDAQAMELAAAAAAWSMDVLVETHSAEEITRGLQLSPALIGINNRNLKTLEVDIAMTETLVPIIEGADLTVQPLIVSESGLFTRADLDRIAECGVGCFLIGESLMRQNDVAAATKTLLQPISSPARTPAKAAI